MKLTADGVRKRIAGIRSQFDSHGDDARSHMDADKLYEDVLMAIEAGMCDDPAACAGAVLEVRAIPFQRYYE